MSITTQASEHSDSIATNPSIAAAVSPAVIAPIQADETGSALLGEHKITISPSAQGYLQDLLSKQADGTGVRIFVEYAGTPVPSAVCRIASLMRMKWTIFAYVLMVLMPLSMRIR